LFPTILTGFALSFARAVGEYGSVTFVSANLPFKTEIVPALIVHQLDQHEIAAATAIAAVMLVASFFVLIAINWLELWSSRFNK
jgi:sulfate transport system permease protein